MHFELPAVARDLEVEVPTSGEESMQISNWDNLGSMKLTLSG